MSASGGSKYENGIFSGDITSGTLYFFQPNDNRTGISLENDHF
jgi:hypothetical protein